MPENFEETVWTRIRQASDRQTTAMNDFVNSYREPVRRFLLGLRVSPSDAEDIVQEVFVRIIEHDLLKVADQKKGRFRSLILAVTKSVYSNWRGKMLAQKRGGGQAVLSLDGDTERASLGDLAASNAKDEAFDQSWLEQMLRRALEKLREECTRKGLAYHGALERFIQDREATYGSIAQELGVGESQVRHYLERARRKVASYIKAEIAGYCSSALEYRDEVEYLTRYLEKG